MYHSNRITFSGIVSFILLSNFNLGQTSDDFLQHSVPKRQRVCSRHEFKCQSDQTCIDKFITCDGVKNCADGSDETEALCNKTDCPGFSFRCDYGACVDLKAKCNGLIDCVDASDENNLDCGFTEKTKRSPVCKSNEFQCKSQQCIDQKLVCNGKSDCADGTDETSQQCVNNKCLKSAFRCRYGACIDGKFKCDKLRHCMDGSDESSDTCQVTRGSTVISDPSVKSTQSSESCILPEAFKGETFTVDCPETSRCNQQPGTPVPKYSVFRFTCSTPGYQFNDSSFESICLNGKWLPEIKKCIRFCRPLKPINIDLSCSRNGRPVDCDSPVRPNTVVRPRCKPSYKVEQVSYRDLSCQEDGEWTNPLFSCVPECGRIYNKVTKLVLNGKKNYGGAPWHVAVYDISFPEKPLVCAGTIISPQIVLSAAQCFFDGIDKPDNASKFEIAVSKFSRNYEMMDNEFTKFYKIRKIFFSDKGYLDYVTNYAGNIAIIWLAETIILSQEVLPVCFHRAVDGVYSPSENAPAKIYGWGRTEKVNFSETVLTGEIPYISRPKCVKIGSEDFRKSVTTDKFCAGTETGLGARVANIGSGLFFLDAGLYFIRGILSTKDEQGSGLATFTDLAQYVNWINDVKKTL